MSSVQGAGSAAFGFAGVAVQPAVRSVELPGGRCDQRLQGRRVYGPRRAVVTAGLFGKDPYREWEKEEMMRVQKEKLKMRQNKDESKAYYEEVETRRLDVEEARQKKKMDIQDGEDPLLAWERLRDSGELKPLGYEEEDEGGIAIPMASFGIPKFDNGERFDLRLPYADQGYEDPDADVMGKIKNFFGVGRKEANEKKKKSEDE